MADKNVGKYVPLDHGDLATATQAVLQAALMSSITEDDDDLLEMVTVVERFFIDMGIRIFEAYNEGGANALEEVGFGIEYYK